MQLVGNPHGGGGFGVWAPLPQAKALITVKLGQIGMITEFLWCWGLGGEAVPSWVLHMKEPEGAPRWQWWIYSFFKVLLIF